MTLIILGIIVLIEVGIKMYMRGELRDLDGIGHVHNREKNSEVIHLDVMDIAT